MADWRENRRKQLAQMSDQFLTCREYGHAWMRVGSYAGDYSGGGMMRNFVDVVQCGRCNTTRRDRLDARTWELIGRTYDYTDGYTMEGAGFTRRADVRQERFGRIDLSGLAPEPRKVVDVR